jgi:two-component system chemotaxis sensor kinase CheA
MTREPEDSAVAMFSGELTTTLPEIEAALDALDMDPRDAYPAREAYRLFHALKGAAAMVGLAAFGYLLNQAEELLDPETSGGKITPELVEGLRTSIPSFAAYMQAGLGGRSFASHARTLSETLRRCGGTFSGGEDPALAELVDIDARELAACLRPSAPEPSIEPERRETVT